MDRRTFTKMLTGLLAATALPSNLQAKSAIGDQAAFMKALEEKPWLLGYLGTRETELRANLRVVSGRIPNDLKGHFFRNGPALHNIGADRFEHWFDAPGMVQRFTFANNTVTHHGRLVETSRNVAEAKAGGILFSAYGTHAHDLGSGGSADGQNVGNISLVQHAGELLALWEGGSAHVIDPNSLETEGRKNWSPETTGLPFGAHPRIDQDGSMWNIGYSTDPAALILYHIAADGQLLRTKILPQTATFMIHDFMITASKIVIVAPPYVASNMVSETFAERFEWKPSQPTQIFVIDKDALSDVSIIDIDPFWVFHFGNAYDVSPTEIGFDFALHDNPNFLAKDAFAAMDGSWDGAASAASHYVQAKIDVVKKSALLERSPEFGQVEFIQTDSRENLLHHRFAIMITQPGGPNVYGFNRLLLVDRNSGNTAHFDVDATEILEEHLIVSKPNRGDEFWVIGTALDWQSGTTNLSVYEGANLADGPIFKAALDLALPLGFHGIFIPQRRN
jgi:carotenoid cleavage dioxygenase